MRIAPECVFPSPCQPLLLLMLTVQLPLELPHPAVNPRIVHPDVYCDACLEAPGAAAGRPPRFLKGVRYQCLECDDVDLCTAHRLGTVAGSAHEASHTLVPWHTPHAVPIPHAPLVDILRGAFAAYSQRPFLGLLSGPSPGAYAWLTYADVWRRACAFAGGLQSATREHAEPPFVGICLPNGVDWVVADIACALLGYPSVPMYPGNVEEVVRTCPTMCAVVCLASDWHGGRIPCASALVPTSPTPTAFCRAGTELLWGEDWASLGHLDFDGRRSPKVGACSRHACPQNPRQCHQIHTPRVRGLQSDAGFLAPVVVACAVAPATAIAIAAVRSSPTSGTVFAGGVAVHSWGA